MERTFRLTLEYDGTEFRGWQSQPGDVRTLQDTLEAAVAKVTGQSVRVTGAGRTDSGVHAEGQVASLRVDTALDPPVLARALNAALPPDFAVREVALAPDGFDARHHATGKLYRYDLWNGPVRSPLLRQRSLAWFRPMDATALRRAAQDLVGSHDFASFQAAGSDVSTTMRTLRRLEIGGEVGGVLSLWFEGSGFLRHMVRNLVGTLLEVAGGKRNPEGMPALLAACDRSQAGPTAPAHGLTLVRVSYGPRSLPKLPPEPADAGDSPGKPGASG
ncbi:MAG: tRNA pseudouridine(38-40) synthase TruA [Myxococcota bacterium]